MGLYPGEGLYIRDILKRNFVSVKNILSGIEKHKFKSSVSHFVEKSIKGKNFIPGRPKNFLCKFFLANMKIH